MSCKASNPPMRLKVFVSGHLAFCADNLAPHPPQETPIRNTTSGAGSDGVYTRKFALVCSRMPIPLTSCPALAPLRGLASLNPSVDVAAGQNHHWRSHTRQSHDTNLVSISSVPIAAIHFFHLDTHPRSVWVALHPLQRRRMSTSSCYIHVVQCTLQQEKADMLTSYPHSKQASLNQNLEVRSTSIELSAN